MSQAPLTLRIVLLVLLCGSCMMGLTGALSGNRAPLMIAAGLLALSGVIVLAWRVFRSK